MGTARQDVYDLLKTNLYQDDAVTGKCSAFKANNHLRPYQASVFFCMCFLCVCVCGGVFLRFFVSSIPCFQVALAAFFLVTLS